MPIYLLVCDDCYNEIDYYSSIDERDNYQEQCCGKRMRRSMTSFSNVIIFRGSGWPIKTGKIDKWVNFVEQTCSEPACASEINEGLDMIKERKKLKEEQRVSYGKHKLGKGKI